MDRGGDGENRITMKMLEPTVGATIRICRNAKKEIHLATIGEPCRVVERIGPNLFRVHRKLAAGELNWCERFTSWVEVQP